jgi:hypothetical protein
MGLEADIVLPFFTPDPSRYEWRDEGGTTVRRYLDTPSLYMGGSAAFETDIGFGWFHGRLDGEMTKEKITFRPFWRTIFEEDGVEKNVYAGTPIDATQHYFFPGDRIHIELVCEIPHHLTFTATLLEPSKDPDAIAFRKRINEPAPLIVDHIKAPGNGVQDAEYKIVCAIDQYHNEGRPTQATSARSKGSTFEQVNLFYETGEGIAKTPFFDRGIQTMLCPDNAAFTITPTTTGDCVDIDPSRLNS